MRYPDVLEGIAPAGSRRAGDSPLLTVPLLLFPTTPSFPLEPQYRATVRTSVQAWTGILHPAMEILTTPQPPATSACPHRGSRAAPRQRRLRTAGYRRHRQSFCRQAFSRLVPLTLTTPLPAFGQLTARCEFVWKAPFRVIAKMTATASMLGVCSAALCGQTVTGFYLNRMELGADDERHGGRRQQMRLRTQVSEPVVDEYLCQRGASGSGHRLPFVDRFKMRVKTSHREGKIQDSLEERMQGANEAWWRDVKICRCKDVQWRVKCRRMVDQVYSVFVLL